MRSVYAPALAVAALGLGLLSTTTAITGEVDLGVAAEDPGGVVREVAPESPAWRAGIRPGQRVLVLIPPYEPGGWAIGTTDGDAAFQLTSSAANAPLRMAGVAGLCAVGLGLLGLIASRTRRRRSELLASTAAIVAVAPYLVLAPAGLGSVTLVVASVAPGLWLARWHPMPRQVAIGVLAASLVIGLALAGTRLAGSSFDEAFLVAWALLVGASAAAMLTSGLGITRARIADGLRAIRVLDGVVVAASVLGGAVLYAIGVPVIWVAIAWAIPLLAYARARRTLSATLDRMLLAELRERSAIRATEGERARMAREIHDDPLQAIAGVIQQLENPSPDTAAARESLRDVAARLRGVATELHPPVLDDLGLVPAIEATARLTEGMTVEVTITDSTGYSKDDRPPNDVELAAFRIVQEAINNAVRHSDGSSITISGEVGARLVSLAVDDDGVGFSEQAAEAALRAGHIGMSSMRQRAGAIDAALEVDRSPRGGCRVSMRWPA
jgi:signal transduction histidine kinase